VKRVLLDENVPHDLRRWLAMPGVETVAYRGWSGYDNGRLLNLAAGEYDVVVTGDKHLPDQQNVERLGIAVVVLPTTHATSLQAHLEAVRRAIDSVQPGRICIISDD